MSVNPRFYDGALPEKVKVAAVGSVTWEAGQPYKITDTGVKPIASEGTQLNGFFAETQASATTAGDKVWVHRLSKTDQRFICCVTSGGTDTKATQAYVGNQYGLAVNSCIGTISVGNTSDAVLYVYGRLADVEPFLNDTGDVPGKLICGTVAAALQA
jgi:hypothetical protein